MIMKKILFCLFFTLALVGCGNNGSVYTPDHKSQIDDNTARIKSLEERVSNIESDLTTTELALKDEIDRLDQADQDNLDLIRDEIESLSDDIGEAISNLQAEDDKLRQKINRALYKISILKRRFNRFERGSRYLMYAIEELGETVSELSSDLSSLADAVNQNEDDIEELGEDIDDLEEDVEDNSEAIEDLLENSNSCNVAYRSLHTHGNRLYSDIYLVCGAYEQRLKRHTRIEDEEGDR
jgi:chromosome segregation ATPase